jgi:hypothetical protein
MDKEKKTISTPMVTLITRPKLIGVAAAVAILLMLILAPSTAFTENIRFTGTVTDINPPPPYVGARWWNVTVEEVISGPQTSCDILRVELLIIPDTRGQVESGIAIGDQVEVYGGDYSPDCSVSLNGESYYIKKIAPEAPALTPTGLIALVSLLSAIAAVTLTRRKRR